MIYGIKNKERKIMKKDEEIEKNKTTTIKNIKPNKTLIGASNDEVIYKLNEKFPQLCEDFISLEGEGIGVGIPSLFIRVNKCNNTCNFCDTAFSIPGSDKAVVLNDENEMVDSKQKLINYLKNKYTIHDYDIHNLTITGGEPLLNIDYFNEFIESIVTVFPKINRVIIETNGSILNIEDNCYRLIKQIGKIKTKFEFILSISPKLNGKISHANKLSNCLINNMYKRVLVNYRQILDRHFGLQLKFVHSDVLKVENQPLIDFALTELERPIHRNNILVMPFTPNDPFGKDLDEWNKSKDDAALFALKHFYRYSPRLHLDRNLQ